MSDINSLALCRLLGIHEAVENALGHTAANDVETFLDRLHEEGYMVVPVPRDGQFATAPINPAPAASEFAEVEPAPVPAQLHVAVTEAAVGADDAKVLQDWETWSAEVRLLTVEPMPERDMRRLWQRGLSPAEVVVSLELPF